MIIVGNNLRCNHCRVIFDNNKKYFTDIFTDRLPDADGYYWVTRAGLGFWVMVKIVKDELIINEDDPFIIMLFDGTTYRLNEFCNLGTIPFWWGPILKPGD